MERIIILFYGWFASVKRGEVKGMECPNIYDIAECLLGRAGEEQGRLRGHVNGSRSECYCRTTADIMTALGLVKAISNGDDLAIDLVREFVTVWGDDFEEVVHGRRKEFASHVDAIRACFDAIPRVNRESDDFLELLADQEFWHEWATNLLRLSLPDNVRATLEAIRADANSHVEAAYECAFSAAQEANALNLL